MSGESELVDFLLRYVFVAWFAVAVLLVTSSRTNALFAGGIGLLGVPGFLGLLMNEGVINPWDLPESLGPSIYVLAVILVLIGAWFLNGSGARDGSAPGQAPAEASESLVTPRNKTNSYTRGEALRTALYHQIEGAARQLEIANVGFKSPDYSGQVWLRFDFSFPQDQADMSLRASLVVHVERFDYHRFEHLLNITITLGARTIKKVGFIELTDDDIESILMFIQAGGTFPRLKSRRVRQGSYDLWRPINKVLRLRTDYFAAVLIILIILSAIPFFPVAILLGLGLAFYLRRRKTFVLTTGKPVHDPRHLIRMDSWQTNIAGLGTRSRDVRGAVAQRLTSNAGHGLRIESERIWYAGVDGKVERTQLVCSFRRAIAFLHVEPYGADLYVGWDSHVNTGTWVEESLSKGIDKQSGKFVTANRVVPGWHTTNEYDIVDVNFLTEWLHANVTKVVQLKLAEYKVDQEIDFRIQRESRKDALGTSERDRRQGDRKEGSFSGLASRLQRVR